MARETPQRRVPWRSNITEVGPDSLRTHGMDQREIISTFSYEEMVFFLLKGRRPRTVEADLLRAVIVAHISHGITGQSSLAVMEAADCRSGFLHAAIAGFSVGAGIFHQGGLAAAMTELERYADMNDEALIADLNEHLRRKERIMGFGHRFHTRDPRAVILIQIAEKHNSVGQHLKTALKIERILEKRKGLAMNIEAAGGGILLDLGISPAIAHLIILAGRSPMFAALYLERLAQGRKPFQKIEVFDVLEQKQLPDA